MTAQPVTVNLPEVLYRQLQVRARQHQRSVADEALELLATAVQVAEGLPDDLEQALAPLELLDDAELWRAARSSLLQEAARRLEELHHKQQREGLTTHEDEERAHLVRQYERAMLVRAQAAALLKERGHDISSLLASA